MSRFLTPIVLAALLLFVASIGRADLYVTTLDDSGLHDYAEGPGGTPIAPSTYVPLTPGGNPILPGGIAVDPSGNIYVSDVAVYAGMADPNIYEFSKNGTFEGVFASLAGAGANPAALGWYNGSLYAGNLGGNNVEQFSSAGVDQGAAATIPNTDQVASFTWDKSGTLYVGGFSSGDVYKIGAGGTASVYVNQSNIPVNDQFGSATGLLFGPSHELYVSNGFGSANDPAGSIDKFDSNGNFTSVFASSAALGNAFPTGLLFSRDGNSILATLSGTSQTAATGALLQIAVSNGAVTTVEGSLFAPTGLAYSPIPEPSSCILAVIGGVASLGLVVRQRRSRGASSGE